LDRESESWCSSRFPCCGSRVDGAQRRLHHRDGAPGWRLHRSRRSVVQDLWQRRQSIRRQSLSMRCRRSGAHPSAGPDACVSHNTSHTEATSPPPAINDPTTGVLSIDQIHHLLRRVGNRCLDEGVIRDEHGRIVFMYRTPDWEDFVKLAVTELRQFGGSSIQIVRRLRAMLENLIETLPQERTVPLRPELALLDRTAERFVDPEDRELAAVGDSQGLGGTGQRPQTSTKTNVSGKDFEQTAAGPLLR